MTLYLLKRLSIAAAILLIMSSSLFVASRTDDPRDQLLTTYISQEQWEALGKEFGLDRPLVVQYVDWVADSIRADFGNSLERRTSTRNIAMEYAADTLRLVVGALAFSAIFSAASVLTTFYLDRKGFHLEHIGRLLRVIVPAIPAFIPGVLLAHIFFQNSLLFPITGGGVSSYVLPSAALGLVMTYAVVRLYVAARKDVSNPENPHEFPVVGHMLLRLVRSSHIYLPVLLAAILFTEIIFDMRGLTNLMWPLTFIHDFPLGASAFMTLTIAYVVVMLLMDVVRAFLDPLIRGDSSNLASTDRALIAIVRTAPTREWPLFSRGPMVALTMFGVIAVLAILVPNFVAYTSYPTGLGRLSIMFHEFRYVLLTMVFALTGATIIGAGAALIANRLGGIVDRFMVWVFDLFISLPILLLGLALSYALVRVFTGTYVVGFVPHLFGSSPYYIYASMFPAGMLAIISSGMFFHRVREYSRASRGLVEIRSSQIVRGILTVAALSAGPMVMMGAIFDVALVFGATGWAGPLGRSSYPMISIWWTLLAALVLILTILSLNFLGQWAKERLDQQPDRPADTLTKAPAEQPGASGS